MKKMKAFLFSNRILFSLIIAIAFLSCEDNSSEAHLGEFTFMETSYALNYGVITDVGPYDPGGVDSGFRWYILSMFETTEKDPSIRPSSNHGLYVNLGSVGLNDFEEITFELENIWFATEDHFFHASFFVGEDYKLHALSDGSITVSKKGNTFEVDFNFSTENGELLKGSFSGEFEWIDDSGE